MKIGTQSENKVEYKLEGIKMKNKFRLKAKITACVWAGTCFALLSAGPALAAERATDTLLIDRGGGVSAAYVGQGYDNSALASKHQEVDTYIFKEGGLEKFRELGFTVTQTGPMNGKIEIGILPYEDRFADELYAIFGEDEIRVVEGFQAVTLVEPELGAITLPAMAGGDTPISDRDGWVSSGTDMPVSALVVGAPEPADGMAVITTVEAGGGVDPNAPVDSIGHSGGAVPDIAVTDDDLIADIMPVYEPEIDEDLSIGIMPVLAPEENAGFDADIMPVSAPEDEAASASDANDAEAGAEQDADQDAGQVGNTEQATDQKSDDQQLMASPADGTAQTDQRTANYWPWVAALAAVAVAATVSLRKLVKRSK